MNGTSPSRPRQDDQVEVLVINIGLHDSTLSRSGSIVRGFGLTNRRSGHSMNVERDRDHDSTRILSRFLTDYDPVTPWLRKLTYRSRYIRAPGDTFESYIFSGWTIPILLNGQTLTQTAYLCHALAGRMFKDPSNSRYFEPSPCDLPIIRLDSGTCLENHILSAFFCIFPES